MGFNEFMTKLFGNKSQRDLKEITPYVDKINIGCVNKFAYSSFY